MFRVSVQAHLCPCAHEAVHNLWTTSPWIEKAGIDAVQSHPLRRTCFGQYRASSVEVTERWEEKALVHWNCNCWLDTTRKALSRHQTPILGREQHLGTGLTWVEARSCTCPCPILVVSNQTFQFCVLSLVFSKTTMDEIRSRKPIRLVPLFYIVMKFYNSQWARVYGSTGEWVAHVRACNSNRSS